MDGDLPLINGRIDAIALVGLLYQSKDRKAARATLSSIGGKGMALGSQLDAGNMHPRPSD